MATLALSASLKLFLEETKTGGITSPHQVSQKAQDVLLHRLGSLGQFSVHCQDGGEILQQISG